MLRSKWIGHYGYIEAVVKVPNVRGAWTAFWLYPYNHVGAAEIDIFEIVRNDSTAENTSRSYHALHPSPTDAECPHKPATFVHPLAVERWRSLTPGFNYAEGFHKFAALWEPGRVRMYVDDVLIFDTPFTWPQTKDVSDCRLAPPATVMLNYALGGNWAGSPVAASLPSSMIVKSVKIWQK
jgi:beta-glucanase (GH16 family)